MRSLLRCAALAAHLSLIANCSPSERNEPPPEHASTPVSGQPESLGSAAAALARWSPLTTLPIVPVSAANLPDGKVLLWSAEDRFGFGNDLGRTYSVTFDPSTGVATERLVSETGHDMFCPGTANLPDGRVLVNGGLSSPKTSIFNPATGVWTTAATMNIPRAYQGTTPLQDGSVLTLGGSWAGGVGNKHGEIWSESTGWRRASGVLIDPFLSVDPTRNFGMDSHLWLLSAGNGRVFHAGPGTNMNWIHTSGNGRVVFAGRRDDDEFSINGTAVMFDEGRILKAGGGPGYDSVPSNANSYIVELDQRVNVRKIQPMSYRRAFHNAVVLPNGQVVIIGGATQAVGFSDNNSVLAPELFDPLTETFVTLPPMASPRNYHSIALLLPDGRVLSAGGGLCGSGCAANHPDLQILSPPYLFRSDGTPATRPAILSAPTQVNHGVTVSVSTDSPVVSFALLRSSSTTHALNNDQRRIPVESEETSPNNYDLKIPSNTGWALPGLYMLFAVDANGVPSMARTLRVGSSTPLKLTPVDDQSTSVGAETLFALSATGPSGELTYAATGLPPGLGIEPTTGRIQGIATTVGEYLVEVSASDHLQTVSTEFTWNVSEPGTTRYVLFQALSEVNNNPWASAAELNLLDEDGQVLARGAWSVTADSEELTGESGAVGNAFDGNPATIWHTQWQAAAPTYPHWLLIDLGGTFKLGGLRYLPRPPASPNGTIARYTVQVSSNGVVWGNPVAEGNMLDLGAAAEEKTVYFNNVAAGKLATQSSTLEAGAAARAVDSNRNGVFANGSVSQTAAEPTPWWEVDLAATHEVLAVRLFNRAEFSERLSNFYVLASDKPLAGRTLSELLADPTVTSMQTAGPSGAVRLLSLRTLARYVRVQLVDANPLSLAEVEVYGRLAANRAPSLVQPSGPDLLVGVPVSLALAASDPDGDALTYEAGGLPPGLVLDAATGVISGTASLIGRYNVSVSVKDGRGGSASGGFLWIVGDEAPGVGQVAAPIVGLGNAVSYVATAAGTGPFEYQWNFGDGTGDTGFSSDADVSHTFAAAGVYVINLTVRNAAGISSSRQFVQAITTPALPTKALATGNITLESRSDGTTRLWVVNQDNDSVSVFDTFSLQKLAEITVGAQPRSIAVAASGRLYVANKGGASLSVIDVNSLQVVQTLALPRASQPYGELVGSDGNLFVTLEAVGKLLKLNAAGAILATLDLGANPRHFALTASGSQLLVSRFISRFQPGEATASVQTAVNGVLQGGDVMVVNSANLALANTITLRHSDKPDTTVSGRGLPNYLGAPALSPDGQSAWVPGKQDNIQRGLQRDLRGLDFQNTLRAISSRIDLVSGLEDYAARVDHDNSGLASAALYHPSGAYLFVALETSRQVAVLDASGKRELFRIDAGRAPQGLALSQDGRTLFVHNFMDRSVGVYGLGKLLDFGESVLPLMATLSSVTNERLSSQVLRGKQLFYDAKDTRLSRDAYISCASCHNDGGHDGRTWDFTGQGEGLRNTISLRGRAGAMGRVHWSANFDEIQDFEGQLRSLTQGTGLLGDALFFAGTRSQPLGLPKAGLSGDLDALAAYVSSLSTFDSSPNRSAAGALTTEATAGRTVFASKCVSCHDGAGFTDSPSLSTRDVGTLKPSSGARLNAPLLGIDTPTLRDVWATAPYLHDGSAATIEAAVSAHTNISLTASELANVSAFVRQIGAEEAQVLAPVAGTGLTGLYFSNYTLTGSPVFTRTEAVNFNWGSVAPAPGVPADNYSARWAGQVLAPTTGSYRFRTVSDAGVRVWVNNQQLINSWTSHTSKTDTSSAITLTAGQRYDIRVEYYERTGSAVMQLSWLTPGTSAYASIPVAQLYPAGVGLTAHYFANNALTGAPSLKRYEAINFNWAANAPDAALPVDNFSVRWSGRLVAPTSGTYRLQTISDDGVRMWINGTLLIDNWTPHGATTDAAPALYLNAGTSYAIVVEYNELGGDATAQLQWQTPSASTFVAVPAAQLFPTGVGLRGEYFANNALTGTAALTRTEAVNFDWGTGAPAANLPVDNFSARWSGQLSVPTSGSYRFQTLTDDGIRVWVNNVQLINNWTAHGPTLDTSAGITLNAGQPYDIRVEFNELTGGATMRLAWQIPGAPGFVSVPAGVLNGQ